MHSIVRWTHAMSFIGVADSGHGTLMDTGPAAGGHNSAATPKELLLHALGGCTGMDVVSILRKMKVDVLAFAVAVQGEIEEKAPRAFTSFHLDYRFEGQDLPLSSLERAVTLSQEKYCSIAATLSKSHPITWSITVNGETVARSKTASAAPA